MQKRDHRTAIRLHGTVGERQPPHAQGQSGARTKEWEWRGDAHIQHGVPAEPAGKPAVQLQDQTQGGRYYIPQEVVSQKVG